MVNINKLTPEELKRLYDIVAGGSVSTTSELDIALKSRATQALIDMCTREVASALSFVCKNIQAKEHGQRSQYKKDLRIYLLKAYCNTIPTSQPYLYSKKVTRGRHTYENLYIKLNGVDEYVIGDSGYETYLLNKESQKERFAALLLRFAEYYDTITVGKGITIVVENKHWNSIAFLCNGKKKDRASSRDKYFQEWKQMQPEYKELCKDADNNERYKLSNREKLEQLYTDFTKLTLPYIDEVDDLA